MMVGTVYKNVSRHIDQIMNKWEGMIVNVERQVPDIDKMGRVVGVQTSSFTILASIGSIPKEGENSVVGWLDSSNMAGLFWGTTIQKHDRILWEGMTYEVIKIHNILDIDEKVCTTAELTRIAGDGQ